MRYLMMSKNMGVMTAVGLVGWLSGSMFERYKKNIVTYTSEECQSNITPLPGLPLYGSVSAATPIAEDLPTKIARVQNRTAQIMRYGFPSMDHVRSYNDFVLSFDRRTRVANWVFEHMTPERLQYNKDIDRTLCDFTEDNTLHRYFRATNRDYKGSGYDRGHLAAASNHRLSQSDVEETFLLSNIAPQVGVGFNRHAWNSLEKYTRRLVKRYINLYVCTGPLYLPTREGDRYYVKYEVIGQTQVAVPTHFFKVIVKENQDHTLEMEAFLMPNRAIEPLILSDEQLFQFRVPPDVIERNAGLLFFDRLSREKLVMVNGKKSTTV